MRVIRVLLVDDHVLFRKGLASLMAARPEIEVVGEASDGLEAVEKARELRPDLILMDISMPGCDGIEATRRIRAESPDVRVVMLTVSQEEEDLRRAIESGAWGYLLKSLDPESLFEQMQDAVRGEATAETPAPLVVEEAGRRRSRPRRLEATEGEDVPLTNREQQVLTLVVEGASNKEIAQHLRITEGTVKNHLHHMLEKLHLENRVQIAAYALRRGLVRRIGTS